MCMPSSHNTQRLSRGNALGRYDGSSKAHNQMCIICCLLLPLSMGRKAVVQNDRSYTMVHAWGSLLAIAACSTTNADEQRTRTPCEKVVHFNAALLSCCKCVDIHPPLHHRVRASIRQGASQLVYHSVLQ